MDTKMTYEQIEREFDELFVKKVMLIDEPDKLAYEEMKYQVEPEAIKSFLKQSFIKYLQSQVEEYEKDISYELAAKPSGEAEEIAEWYKVKYIKDKITHLQAQIKELEA